MSAAGRFSLTVSVFATIHPAEADLTVALDEDALARADVRDRASISLMDHDDEAARHWPAELEALAAVHRPR